MTLVCEKMQKEIEYEEDSPNCKTMKEEKCKTSKSGKKFCMKLPRKVCNAQKVNKTKVITKTECYSKMVQVCGRETCPIVQGDIKCDYKVKWVRKSTVVYYVQCMFIQLYDSV